MGRKTVLTQLGAGVAATLMLTSACGASGSDSGSSTGDYKFGVMIPLTGPAAPIGETLKRGVDIAVTEINAAGGVDGMKLVPLYEDNKATAEGGAAAANKLMNLEKVPYAISSISSSILAALPIAERDKVVMINNGASDPALLDKPYLYNNQVMNDRLIPPLADYVHSKGFKTAAVMSSEDPYGKSGREVFTSAWTAAGGKIVADEQFVPTTTDMASQLRAIKNAKPDVLFVMATGSPFGTIVKQARAAGIDAQITGPLATQALIQTAASDADGVIDIGRAVDPQATNTNVQAFLSAYKTKYGVLPDWISCVTSESVHILAKLIAQARKDGDDPRSGASLEKAFDKAGPYPNSCVDGELAFLDDHAVTTPLELRQVEGGTFKTLKILTPQDGKFVESGN